MDTIKNTSVARYQWLMPVILATQEKDQEDLGSKPAQAKKKRAGGVAQSEGPEFKPQYHKKKKSTTSTFEKV
jgi:hypothetical protein